MHNPHSDAKHSGPPALPASGILLLPRPRPAGDPRIGRPAGNQTAELAHDARNLFSALDLYCELLATPGVLAPGFRHYAEDLRLVAGSGARLIEALSCPAASSQADHLHGDAVSAHNSRTSNSSASPRRPLPAIEDLAAELMALETPLRVLAGPEIRLEVECAPCAGLLALNSEDLLRILFNLVANSVEAMMETSSAKPRRSAFLRITAQRAGGDSFLVRDALNKADGLGTVVLSVRDNGPGIAATDLPHIFEPGFSTRHSSRIDDPGLEQTADREDAETAESPDLASCGLGLSIVRQLAEAAGGVVRAVCPPGLGTRFDIELPIVAMRPAALRLESAMRPGRADRRRNVGQPGSGQLTSRTHGQPEIENVRRISAQIRKEV